MTPFPFSTNAVLESLSDGFQAFDQEWRCVYLNRRAEKNVGRSRETLLGKVFWQEYPESVGTPFHTRCREAMETGKPVVFEFFSPRESTWTEFSLHPYAGGLGVFSRDITERKQAEEALRQSEQQYRALFDQVQSAVVLADDSGRYTEVSPAACELFGLSRPELIGKSVLDFSPPGTEAHVTEAWQEFLKAGAQAGEFVLQHPDGTQRMLEFRARAGVRPGLHLSVLRDITDQRRAEKQARALFEDLREERDILDTVNRIGRLLSGELDLHKLVQAATDAATELTGAQFGAFFYNTINAQGESLLLYTISGAPLEAFSRFPHPRATPLFGPTFRAEGTIRIGDVTKDARYGHIGPHFGMPEGHLPVRSYLAVPVVSRSGEVLGGLFFGHEEADVFSEKAERNLVALVAQVAIAVDNARLYEKAQREADVQARQAQHAELRADVSAALALGGPLREMLQRCVEPLVDHLQAAFARIWTLDDKQNVLVLQASAGMYTHLDGSHSRVPVGEKKIGLIALEKRPHSTNDVLGDERIADKEWATREGLVAFAGYPLLLENRVVGVVAMFTRHAVTPDTVDALAAVADALAQGVDRKQVEQRLLESEARQRGILQNALASVTGGRLRLCAGADDLPERFPAALDSDPIALTRESLRSVRLRATKAAESAGLDSERIIDLLTAVGEASMNAVTHAGGGTADIRVNEKEVQVWIEDHGSGIEMNRLPDATLRHGHSTTGTLGHGFKMMLQSIDRLWLLTGPTGTIVVLEQGREAPLPNWLTET